MQGIDMNWDDLQSEKNYNLVFVYAQSKLANILFTVELARRFKGKIEDYASKVRSAKYSRYCVLN